MISIHDGPYIRVTNNSTGVPWINPSQPSAGITRWHMNTIQVYDGMAWHSINENYTVQLSPAAEQVIEWAHQKMQQEKKLADLAEKSPAVADVVAALKHAQQQVDIVVALAQQQ